MTIGVFEALALFVIWLATMITLTVLQIRDVIRRRRCQWHRGIRALGNAVQRARR